MMHAKVYRITRSPVRLLRSITCESPVGLQRLIGRTGCQKRTGSKLHDSVRKDLLSLHNIPVKPGSHVHPLLSLLHVPLTQSEHWCTHS